MGVSVIPVKRHMFWIQPLEYVNNAHKGSIFPMDLVFHALMPTVKSAMVHINAQSAMINTLFRINNVLNAQRDFIIQMPHASLVLM